MQWKRFVRALSKGCTLTIGAGQHRLRVVRIENAAGELVGYGEHGELAPALAQAEETYRKGLGTYADTFARGRFLSGTRRPSGSLDGLVLGGAVLVAAREGTGFSVRIENVRRGPVSAERPSLHRAVRAAVRDALRLESAANASV